MNAVHTVVRQFVEGGEGVDGRRGSETGVSGHSTDFNRWDVGRRHDEVMCTSMHVHPHMCAAGAGIVS